MKKLWNMFFVLLAFPTLTMAAAVTPTVISTGTPVVKVVATATAIATSVPTSVSTPAQTPVPTPYVFTANLAVGSKGTEVLELQKVLGLKDPDGHFGQKTKDAVMKFQELSAIKQTGNVGMLTRKALNEMSLSLSKPIASPTPAATKVVTSSTPTVVVSVTPRTTPMISPTVTPVATIIQKKKSDWEGQLGMSMNFAPSVSAGTLPMGFQFLNTKSAEPEFFLQVKYKYIALNASVNLVGQDVTMDIYGSSLNTIHIYTPLTLTLKCYPLDGVSNDWSVYPYIGIGVEYTQIQGNFSMGGFNFDTSSTDNLTPIIPIGVEFGKDIHFSLGYVVRTVALDTFLPGVGILEYQETGDWQCAASIPF